MLMQEKYKKKLKTTGSVQLGIGMELSWVYLIPILVVKVSSRGDECPPWFTLDYTSDSLFPQCVCSQAMSSYITCNQRERTSYIKISHCAFLDEVTNDTVVTSCPYVFLDTSYTQWTYSSTTKPHSTQHFYV